jgi:hypothetical protein
VSTKTKPLATVKKAPSGTVTNKPTHHLPSNLRHATSRGGSLGMASVSGIGQAVSKAHQAGMAAIRKKV